MARLTAALLVFFLGRSSRKAVAPTEPRAAEPPAPLQSEIIWRWIRSRLKREIAWLLTQSLGLISIVTLFGVYEADTYLDGYLGPFSLNPVQVGFTRSEIILRLLPDGVGLILLLAVVRLVILLFYPLVRADHLVMRETGTLPPAKPATGWRRTLRDYALAILSTLTVASLIAAVLLLQDFTSFVSNSGRSDARTTILSTRNYDYNGEIQALLGLDTAIVELRWIGPPEYDPLPAGGRIIAGERTTYARVLAQNGESTYIFDLLSCRPEVFPTIDLQIASSLLSTRPGPAVKVTNHQCHVQF